MMFIIVIIIVILSDFVTIVWHSVQGKNIKINATTSF